MSKRSIDRRSKPKISRRSQTIEQRSIEFFVEFLPTGSPRQHHLAFVFTGAPTLPEVVDALTALVGEQRWWWFAVRWLDGGGKSSTFVRLVPELWIVEMSIADRFHRFDIVDGNRDGCDGTDSYPFAGTFFEGSARQKFTFDGLENAPCGWSSACSIQAQFFFTLRWIEGGI